MQVDLYFEGIQEQALLPSTVLTPWLWHPANLSHLCKSEHSLTLQRVMDRKVFQKELSRTALEMVAKGSVYVRVSHWGLMALFTTAQLRTSIHISESAVWLPCHLIETWCP